MTDHGFAPRNGSGLLVPTDYARTRQVWTNAERRILDRATKLCNSRNVGVSLYCVDCGTKRPLERIQDINGFTLRCDCRDRQFVKGF